MTGINSEMGRYFVQPGMQACKKAILLANIQDETALKNVLHAWGVYVPGDYLHNQWIDWLVAYARQFSRVIEAYFKDEVDLNKLCRDFIRFCFKNGILVDRDKTLESFAEHDARSDEALKKELSAFDYKEEVSLLGFGLGNGDYEKSIASYLIEKECTRSVKIYGFDPHSKEIPGVSLLNPETFITGENKPSFDIIIARWVLHHVALEDRWAHLSHCINCTEPGAIIAIVEHGYWQQSLSKPDDKKIYHLLNAIFDVIANIGIRSPWFTDTAPDMGTDFFVDYLEDRDFLAIKSSKKNNIVQSMYDIGPTFPNQTICSMKIRSMDPRS
jgi:hypothetical protein